MNKTLLCTAVGASLAAATGLAQAYKGTAPYTLLPYVVKDANRTTVVTLIGGGNPVNAGPSLHLQYWTKSTTDANTAACSPSSVTVPFTDADIMTFDTAGLLGYPLFGDTTNPAPLGIGISYAAPRHGYLLVQGINGGSISYSYWLELDLANGGALGDVGINNADPDYDDNTDWASALGAYVGDNSSAGAAAAIAFWPSSVATTVFTVTPLGTDMLNVENSQMVLQVVNWNAVQGAYDRNENGVDGTVPVTVRCVGRVTPAQLMPGVVANASWAAQGGWGFLANLGDNATTTNDRDAMVYQIDQASVGGKFLSNATRIVSHNE